MIEPLSKVTHALTSIQSVHATCQPNIFSSLPIIIRIVHFARLVSRYQSIFSCTTTNIALDRRSSCKCRIVTENAETQQVIGDFEHEEKAKCKERSGRQADEAKDAETR
jgi:hypothetical protein